MNRSKILLLLLSFSWFSAIAQQGTASAPPAADAPKTLVPPTPEMAQQTRQDERHITLNVLATDTTGKPVSGLQQQDFTILDNKQPQTMTSFAAVQGTSGVGKLAVREGYFGEQLAAFARITKDKNKLV